MLNENEYHTLEELQFDLSQHTRNPMLFRTEQYTQYHKTNICEDWSGMNRRRIDFSECYFNECDFERTGFAGSNFTNCTFNNCNIKNTNFSQCSFLNCVFNCDIKSTDFYGSKFNNVVFKSKILSDITYTNAYMCDVEFCKCEIISSNWEFCDFARASFVECSFSMLNFEFAIFGDIHFIDTLIPFQSIPYIFGGPEYVLRTNDDSYFKSEIQGKISLSEYRKYMKEMLEFYKMTNNVFPAANLLLAYGEAEAGYEMIKSGIIQLTELRKYRTLKYLTYLFNISNTISNKKKPHLYTELFDTINKVSKSSEIDCFDKRMYFEEIRNTLLSTENGGCVFTFKTNIDSTETEQINILYYVLDKVADCFEGSSHRIHISHNSDIVMELIIAGIPAVITAASQVITAIINKNKKENQNSNIDSEINININTDTINISPDRIQEITEGVKRLNELGINLEALCAIYSPQKPNVDTSELHKNK